MIVRPEGDGAVVALDDDGSVIGRVDFGASDDVAGAGAVTHLHVDEAYRRTGVGTTLLVAAEDALHAEGYEEAVTWVDQRDEGAQRFLAWHSWSTDGETREVRGSTEARFRRLLGF